MSERILDRWGNELFSSDESKEVFLRLSERNEVKTLGHINGRTFYVRRKASNTMHTLNELGFSSLLVSRGNFDLIRIHLSDGRELEIERKKVLEIGTYKHFQSRGYERQVFVPMSAFREVPGIASKKRTRRRHSPAIERDYYPA